MIKTKFINNKVALYTLIIGCFVVSVSMGIRQTYGIFFQFFETDLNITSTYFGLAIGVQAIVWGIFATFLFCRILKHERSPFPKHSTFC